LQSSESAISATATYVENYLDCVESLPDDMQRNISQMRELDLHYQERLKEIERLINSYFKEKEPAARRKCLIQIQRRLIRSQEYGDDKLQLVGNMMDLVDTRTRQIEVDVENLDTYRNDDMPPLLKPDVQPGTIILTRSSHYSFDKTSSRKVMRVKKYINEGIMTILEEHHSKPEKTKSKSLVTMTNMSVTQRAEGGQVGQEAQRWSSLSRRRQRPIESKLRKTREQTATNSTHMGKSKNQDSPTPEYPIDPNEPTYCLCNQVSFGEMIGCDNEECPIEWFHFQCVGLTTKPKGKW
ncbi:unnamed protein product, partial [Pocillopora meandrina]